MYGQERMVALWSVQDGEVDSQLVFFTDEACFHYVERWILRPVGIVVQKIQDLFTDSLFMKKKLMFGVHCMPAVRLQQFLVKNSRE